MQSRHGGVSRARLGVSQGRVDQDERGPGTVALAFYFAFLSSRRRHTRYWRDWSSDVWSSDLRAKSNCRVRTTGKRGRRSRAAINLTRPGRYTVTWRVHGKRVKRRGFRARAPRVFVNGDSLAVGTRPYLPRALPGGPVRQSTSISRQAGEGAAVLRAQGPNLAQIIFVSLGTNGSAGATGSFRDAIRAVMHVAGPDRCVVWANIVRPGAFERLNRL